MYFEKRINLIITNLKSMKNLLIISVLAMLVNIESKTQIQNFDLTTYKLPYLEKQLLDVNFNFGQNANNYYYTDNTNKNSSINGYGFLNYNFYLNSPAFQCDETASLQLNGNTSNSKVTSTYNPSVTNKTYGFSGIMNISAQNRIYNTKKQFIEFDCNARSSSSNNKQDSTDKYTSSFNNFVIPIKIGFGRIERVEDARLAVYILNDLSINNKLSHQPSDDEILSFSKLISELMTQRFFDARIKKIYELTKVDSFLRSNNLVKENDMKSFALINDNWDYAAGPARSSGFRFDIGVSPNLEQNVNWTKNTGLNAYNSRNLNLQLTGDIFAEYVYEKPINLYWQESFSIKGGYEMGNYKNYVNSVNPEITKENAAFINFTARTGFYPNSRTYIIFNINGMWEHQIFKTTSTNINNLSYNSPQNNINIYPSIVGYYYFSPQLRFTLNESLSIYSNKNNIDNYKYLYNNFNVGLVYSFL